MSDHNVNRRVAALGLAGAMASLTLKAQAQQQLRVAAVYTHPFEHLWVSCVHKALQAAEKRGDIAYRAYENIAPNEIPAVMRKLAQTSPDVIFGECHQTEDTVRQVAASFPKTAFVLGSNGKPQGPNVSVFDNYVHEPAYLEGMLAGGLTQSKHIGMVGGFAAPDVKALMNAFMLGARAVNADVRFSSGAINGWLNVSRAKKMTNTMIDQGADALLAIANSGVVEVAAERRVLAFGSLINRQGAYPNTVVASAMWHVEPVVDAVIQRVRAGAFAAEDYAPYSMMRAKGATLSPLGSFERKVLPDLLGRVRVKEADILSGRFQVPYIETLAMTMS